MHVGASVNMKGSQNKQKKHSDIHLHIYKLWNIIIIGRFKKQISVTEF